MTAAQEQALTTTQPTELKLVDRWQSTSALKARIQAIQQLMNDVLKKDVDYGIVPGMPKGTKPCLFKAGSEQILAMFRIAVDPVVEDLSTDDCFRYRVTTRLTDVRTGEFLGAGVGEASTNETKYKWKRVYSVKEFENTPADRRKEKFSQYRDDHGQWVDRVDMLVRQEPADLANTVLKMAKKRSQVDGTLTVTGASSMFDQDLVAEDDIQQEEAPTQPARRGRKGQPPKQEDVKCADCGAINGHLPSCKYHPSAKKEAAKPAEAKKEEPKTIEGTPTTADKIVCQIKKATRRTTSTGTEYFVYEAMDVDNRDFLFYCFHKTVNEELLKNGIQKVSMLRYRLDQRKDQQYIVVEEIVSIAGVSYKDGKPVAKPPEEEVW